SLRFRRNPGFRNSAVPKFLPPIQNRSVQTPRRLFAIYPSEESAGPRLANLRSASFPDNPARSNQAKLNAPHGSMESRKPPGRNASARSLGTEDGPSR